ncbi:Similar to Ercc4: DNA repair endonuclease XPF (Mus musculus) [Cotesia congregata]|uniref:Similar to Ercc4: DNA repair endonuclease XPF (Mus musculus) n=1 Tax=Cotesia congregata TaxID=51543 RepID=A0A8J2HJF9_COTCN|nr:Similar to Ercc4: DNA repair endonuclease XPF (Mus musculus) [Cotesia congregata]
MYDGIVKILLVTQKGDADLFISQFINKPTYEPDQYCLQSTTCGEDIIFIPQSFKRPVSIGVYGHPSHEASQYNLFVYHVALGADEVTDEQNPGNLVIVLGTIDYDEKYFIDRLKTMNVKTLPKIVTAQNTSNEREIMYLEGGVLFISGRILVVDLLKNRVPLNLVTGILVYRAHGILNSYQEAFALRLYRQKNKTGFIKAFTNSALAFTVGFSQVERVMKTLFVKQLYLWPRFHSVVNSSLSKHKPEVIELHAKLTHKMQLIQSSLLDLMNFIVKDLKRLNKFLDFDELTVENAIAKKFHKQLQRQLDPMWHQLGSSTKQLIADLKLLGYFLTQLIQENSVAFYASINRLRTMEYAMKGKLKPEPSPKWEALNEILSEIRLQINKKDNISESTKRVLILVYDTKTAVQLKNFLTMGAGEYLLYEAMKSLKKNEIMKPSEKSKDKKEKDSQEKDKPAEKEEEEEEENELDSYVLTFSQKPPEEKESEEDQNKTNFFEECSMLADADISKLSSMTEPIILIQSVKRGGDPMALQRTLHETLPGFIIMYGADISSIRQLEVYQNNNPSIALKIFFLVYGGSVEEQGYLTALRREKEAFDKLINTKTTMVIPTDQDGKMEDNITAAPQVEQSTRQGGIESTAKVTPKIIVDIPVSMTRHYAKPMLLIEFDQNKSFCLQGNYYVSRDMKSSDVTSKLQLLTLHFPKLKIVWSPSPQATAQLFEELKEGKPQPDAQTAALIGLEEDEEGKSAGEKYNTQIHDFVAKLPGVHSKNLRLILNKGGSLDSLVRLTEEELTALVGNKSNAQMLHQALHKKYKPENTTSGSVSKAITKVRSKGLFSSVKK